MLDVLDELFADEEAWVVGGAVRDQRSTARSWTSTSPCASPSGRPEAGEARRRSAVPALGTAWRVAGRAGRRPHGRLHAAAGVDRGRPRQARLHDQRDCRARRQRRVPSTRTTASATSPRSRHPRAAGRRLRGRPAAAAARGAARGRARLPDRPGDRGADPPSRGARHRAGGRADPRRAAAALGRRLPAPRRARPAGAARRPDRRPARPLGLARLPAGGRLRRRASPPPRLERAAPLRRCAAAGRAARAGRARDPPLPPRDRAVGARGARLRRRFRARAGRRGGARDDPAEPLLRGDELDLPPGPEIGRLLAEIEEERAAGTIATREEALDYARRHAGSVREDG